MDGDSRLCVWLSGGGGEYLYGEKEKIQKNISGIQPPHQVLDTPEMKVWIEKVDVKLDHLEQELEKSQSDFRSCSGILGQLRVTCDSSRTLRALPTF